MSPADVAGVWDRASALAALDPSEPLRASHVDVVEFVVLAYPVHSSYLEVRTMRLLDWARARAEELTRAQG